jgi:DNA-binding NtrC family response regulator
MQILVNYHWPGNVRELQNIIERACALAKGAVLQASDMHLDVRPAKSTNGVIGFLPEGMTLEHWEDEMIREALKRANGNKSQAARLLGLSRNALRYRLSKIGIADEGEKES